MFNMSLLFSMFMHCMFFSAFILMYGMQNFSLNLYINTLAPNYINIEYIEKQHNLEEIVEENQELILIPKNNIVNTNNFIEEKHKKGKKKYKKLHTDKDKHVNKEQMKNKKQQLDSNENQDTLPKQQLSSGDGGRDESSVESILEDQSLLNYKSPIYPRAAIIAHQEGEVIVKFLLSPEGIIKDIIIVKSSGYFHLDNEVKKTVPYWNIKRNITKDTWIQVVVEFKLQ